MMLYQSGYFTDLVCGVCFDVYAGSRARTQTHSSTALPRKGFDARRRTRLHWLLQDVAEVSQVRSFEC